ncbi:MAG: ABC transporter permease [Desulforhabdus sp.]|jgi:simple sugar transport system permease protein|nr:ABC transporter permease [Desulforhabdus sp.]
MIRLCVHKRYEPPGWSAPLIFFAAVAVSLGIGAAFLAIQGKPAVAAMLLLIKSAYFSVWAIEDCLIKAVPIFLCSLGVAIAFRLQIWNIGAEGQYALGALGATWTALTFPELPWYLLLPAMLLGSSAAGGLWGLIPGLLKVRLRANEIIVTLMLNYIGILFLDYLVYGPWKDPASFGFPMTRNFPPGAVVGLIGNTRLHWGILICIGAGLACWIVLRFTRLGFELQASGENPRAAVYARIAYDRLVVLVLVSGGVLSGWAGFLEASAHLNRLQPSIVAGYGYTAIVVAWLARLNPLSIAVVSFLLAGLRVGLEILQLDLQVPAAFGQIMEGLILLTVLAGRFFSSYRFAWRRGTA